MDGAGLPPEEFIIVRHADPVVSRTRQLLAMSAATGRHPAAMASEFARLALGPGRLNFQDYVQMRLFDEAFVGGAELRAFSGRLTNSDLISAINFDRDAFKLAANKVAMAGYLQLHGLPTIAPQAVYAEGVAWPSPTLLSTPEALAAFLVERAAYPVFCKPADGQQSLGSVVLTGLTETGALGLKDGREVTPHAFARFISRTYPRGYVIQPCIAPPAELAAVTGGALATVRVVTVLQDGAARVLRACLKLPAAGNVADNYWRPGNILAGLEAGTGRVRSASRGLGLALEPLDLAAEAGGALGDLAVRDWRRLQDLARSAHALMPELRLLGWDIAPTAGGPVIVEMNPAPDVILNQIADRRGFLEPDLLAMAARGRLERKAMRDRSRTELQKFGRYGA